MNPYPYGPTSNQAMYPQPIPPQGSYPPPTTYPPPAYPPPVTNAYQQPVVSAPIFGGMQFLYVQDPMTEIASCQSLLIKQEAQFMEALTGCEQPNIYHVFGNSPLGARYLFKCIEKSGWCMRRCCTSSQRSFDMDIIHCSSLDQLGMGYTTPFASMNKPFMCTVCCLCRPEVNLILSSTHQPVGKVKHICTVCDPTFEVYNCTSGLKYIVTADCCQCAIMCPGFLAKTSRGVFDILDAGTSQKVGQITKECATISEMVTDADSYIVNFPVTADANDKLLLTGLALMIDYLFFESDADDDHQKMKGGSTSHRRRRR